MREYAGHSYRRTGNVHRSPVAAADMCLSTTGSLAISLQLPELPGNSLASSSLLEDYLVQNIQFYIGHAVSNPE